jgi:hypothetical protein
MQWHSAESPPGLSVWWLSTHATQLPETQPQSTSIVTSPPLAPLGVPLTSTHDTLPI